MSAEKRGGIQVEAATFPRDVAGNHLLSQRSSRTAKRPPRVGSTRTELTVRLRFLVLVRTFFLPLVVVYIPGSRLSVLVLLELFASSFPPSSFRQSRMARDSFKRVE